MSPFFSNVRTAFNDKGAVSKCSTPKTTISAMSAITTIEVGATVLISGLKAAPELNGTIGTVVGEAPKPGRWHLKTKSSRDGLTSLKEENLTVLSKGTMHASAEAACAAGCGPKGGMHGQGVAQNDIEAVKWWTLAAELGHVFAQNNLGTVALSGIGMIKSVSKAVEWFEMAAEQGHSSSQANLGMLYKGGDSGEPGIPSDNVKAAKYLRLASAQGSAMAQYNLATMLHNGSTSAPDGSNQSAAEEAIKWQTLAAEQGLWISQESLGLMHLNSASHGNGQDMLKALYWLQRACEQGQATSAEKMLDDIQSIGKKYKKCCGKHGGAANNIVPAAAEGIYRAAAVSPGRVAVRLDACGGADAKVLSFKLRNLHMELAPLTAGGDDTRLKGANGDATAEPTAISTEQKVYITCVPQDDPANVLNSKLCVLKGFEEGGTMVSVEAVGKVWSIPRQNVAFLLHDVQTPTKDAGGNDPECFICFEADADVICLGCACRDGAGTAHLTCMIASIEASETRNLKASLWNYCQICHHEFQGPMQLGLANTAVEKTQHLRPGDGKRVHADHLRGFALLYAHRFDEAEAAFRILFRFYNKHFPKTDTTSMELTHGLAESVLRLGKISEAVALHSQNLKLRRHALGAHDKNAFASEGALAAALSADGQYDEAERMYRSTIERMKKHLPENDQHTLIAVCSFVGVLHLQRKDAEVIELGKQMLPVYERVYGPDHPNTNGVVAGVGVAVMLLPAIHRARNVPRFTAKEMALLEAC
eukprot:gene14714-17889_t